MSLWVDKYRPTTLGKLDYHQEQAEYLRNMVKKGDFPHLLVYGPSGAGKKTRILCIIKELYGNGVEKLRMESMTFETPSKKKLEITTISSNYHIEVNPSDVGIYDRVVVMDLVKTTAQTHQIDPSGQREFKVVLLTNVDQLTKDAQHALRRTMEKYVATCRLILCANSTSRVLPAIRSRCLGIRVPAPTVSDIRNILYLICKREGLTLPNELATRVAEASGRNLRRAILMLEACKVEQYPFTADQKIADPDWQVYIRNTANMMVSEQSPKKLLEIRNRLYELLTHAIPCDLIFKGLLQECIKNCDLQLKIEIATVAAEYEHKMHRGSKSIFHLEAFVARFMAIYKKFIDSSLEGFV
ncbi:replication factor C subunit 3 [Osmia bicornis bicornis]|uniref:replication factor C subunit 3 n=1 Tax=Osmia bicornis bicornis TaxID=1437191 RepID=UPI0010F7778F|nr:replication factor C subunit 3 [Osmia bicornis bicornis]XP_029045442.1 replication factor C subunit 3 [Osmia bicornis bicornis]XP_029045443.1 replication factor C subunit 3 [Osmia bicornis bicornis]XP_029045444.1 replication factor C subunit 3 [Osmia bicornis bicornis]